ncbi:dienelactone hydrolase family protein [Niveibacterium sp. SC-1]|uniref:dienelactone hydrolase family protein n=1 Tax=Niveibacterium sp. SC-1 TaxID=3135646 RepID=UPI00311F123F
MSQASFAAAVSPAAATTIHTDEEGVVARDVTIPSGDAQLPAYEARPAASGRFPIVLVIQEIFGVHEHIRDVARRFAKLGYHAIAPELYFRQGDPRTAPDFDTLRREIVNKVPDAQVLSDLSATLDWAIVQGSDGERAGVTGFCWGGRITWLLAASEPRLRAAVAWYGKLEGEAYPTTPRYPIDVVGELRVPVLGLYGEADAGIPAESLARFRAALAADPRAQLVTYPDAPHAFFADYRPSYREAAARDGWQRTLAWFVAHGVVPGER